EIRADALGHGLDGFRLQDVHDEGRRLSSAAPDLLGGRLGAVDVALTGEHDARARRGELERDGAPGPAPATGHDGGSHDRPTISTAARIASRDPAGTHRVVRSIQRTIFVSISPGPGSTKTRAPSATMRSNVSFQSVGWQNAVPRRRRTSAPSFTTRPSG